MPATTIARSADFLATLGVDTHVPYTDGGYVNIKNVAADLAYLGITQVRDGLSDGLWGSAPLSSFITLAKQGITFTAVVVDGTVTNTASLMARFDMIERLVAAVPGSVTAIEGANEINNWPVTYNGVSGLDGALALQKDIYSIVHSTPALAGISVDYFTGYGAGGIANGPDPSTTAGLADYDTQHPYARNGSAPAASMNAANSLGNETPGHIGKFVYTETGYSSNGGTWAGVDQSVQAKYTLDLLFDAMRAGAAQTDLYELMDAYKTGSPQGNDGWGLFDENGAPKLVATAIHNLTGILADTGAAARSFALTAAAPTVTGLPASGGEMALQKSDGHVEVVLWAEPQIWNPATGTEIAAPVTPVTLDFGARYATVSVYDPLVGTTAIQTLTGISSLQVALTDHPLIVEFEALDASSSAQLPSQAIAAVAPGATESAGATGSTGAPATQDNTLAARQMLFGILTHDASSPGGIIDGLYHAILGRDGDPIEMETYVAALDHQTPINVAQALLSSDEFNAHYGSSAQSNDDFLNVVYQNALGRAPDNLGRSSYEALLAGGTSRAAVAAAIATSTESQQDRAGAFQAGIFVPAAADAQVARLYYGLLDRAPDAPGLSGWEQSFAQGQSLEQIAQSFLDSPEYKVGFAGSTDSQFVSAVYQGALGRAPDAGGLHNYDALLANGASRAFVAVNISESQEAKNHLAPQIELGLKTL